MSIKYSWGNQKHCCGNTMFPMNVSLFAHLGKHFCGSQICFPGSKNVFRTNLNLKHYGSKGFQSIDRKQCLCRKLTCINTFPACPFLRMCAAQIILSFAIYFH